jgi:aminopeptidase N
MRKAAAIALLIATNAALSADTYPRQPGVDVLHYVFRLSLSPGDDHRIEGEATIGVRLAASAVSEVTLDLVSPKDGKGMTVSSVTSGGEALTFRHEANRLTITLPADAGGAGSTMFTVRYAGIPTDGLRFVRNLHGEPTVFSQNWPDRARHWLPTIDHPYDKATGEFIIATGSDYQVVANGVLVEERDLDGGRRETHWKQSVPIATWLYAIGVARFSAHHAGTVAGVPLQTWVFPQDRVTGRALFEPLSARVMSFFVDRIGPYPYEKLANIQAAGMSGGMEHATAIFYGEKEVADGRGPVAHEIAHQWFGNSVTERDWDDVWLSEGFATYFDLLFTEHDEGRDAFVERLRRTREQVLQLERKSPQTPVIHDNLQDMERVLNGLIYQKGGWTLHMLRYLVGDAAFWSGIRTYYRQFQNGHASTADFRAAMEDASDLNLGFFFDQWLRRSGVPRLEGEWRFEPAKKQVDVTIRQTQPGDAFRLHFELGIVGPDGRMTRHKVGTDRKLERYSLPADGEPRSVVIDPGVALLYEDGGLVKAGG